eukprot:06629_5
MKQATQLQRINLSTVKLGDTGVENVAVGLIPLCNLKVLVMSKNNIGTDGVKFLSPALRALNALEVLDLSGNPLTVRHVGHSEGDNYYSSGVEGLGKGAGSLCYACRAGFVQLRSARRRCYCCCERAAKAYCTTQGSSGKFHRIFRGGSSWPSIAQLSAHHNSRYPLRRNLR